MIKTLFPFRFSKNISHRLLKKNIPNTTPINISKKTFSMNGKDLYYPKYGCSFYEPSSDYAKKLYSSDVIEGKRNDKALKNKNLFEDKGLPQITNTTEYINNSESIDNRIDYDDENIMTTEKWNSRED